jgi:uncharacterized protein (TIGR03066 family)
MENAPTAQGREASAVARFGCDSVSGENIMRGVAMVPLILVLSAVAAPAADDSPKTARELIVARWELADGKSKGTLEFQKDGSLILSVENLTLKGSYKFLDKKGKDDKEETIEVTLQPPLENAKPVVQKVKITKLTETELVTKDEKDREDKFKLKARPKDADKEKEKDK